MKQNIFKRLALVAVLLFGAITASAYDFEVNDIYYKVNNGRTTVSVTYKDENYNSYDGSVTIPTSVTYSGKTYSVTSIGYKAFYQCSGLTAVKIPNSVTTIGEYAFSGCSGLTAVEIPNSVTTIGSYAFYGCSGLKAVEIPNSVTTIDEAVFSGCSGLTAVEIPNSVTSIGSSAFEACSGLESIIVESGNSVYDSRDNCNAIIETATNALLFGCKNTTIPNSVTSIGNGAFAYCSGLTAVEIPNSVTSIGSSAFYYCSGLTAVEIPNSVTTIGSGAFSGCRGLTAVSIGNSVATIGSYVFGSCYNIKLVAYNAEKCEGTLDFTVNSNNLTFIVGKDVKSIPNVNSSKFSKIISHASTPPTCTGSFASTVGYETPVYVSGSAYSAYWMSEEWGKFTNLQSLTSIVSGIKLSTDSVHLNIGNTYDLSKIISIEPSDATIKDVIWHTDNSRVVTVDTKGVIKGVNKGDATISVKAIDGSGVMATCKVRVDSVLANSIELSAHIIQVQLNSSASLSYTISPSNTTIRAVECSVSDSEVLAYKLRNETSIDFMGLKEGTATITVCTTDGTNLSDSCVVTVSVAPEVAELRLLLTMAEDLYANSEEGFECGQYEPGARAELLEAIEQVRAKMSPIMSKSVIDECTQVLNDAIAVFASKQVSSDDTDISKYENVMYVESVETYIGKAVKLSLKMNNAIEAVGFQCDFHAPEGTDVALDEDGDYLIALSNERTNANRTNMFAFAKQPNGAIRILASSMQSLPFSGNEGEVATIMLDVDSIAAGDHWIILRNIVISDAEGNTYKVPYVKTTLTVKEYEVGDANIDGYVDSGDYTTIVNHILNRHPEPFVLSLADTNCDGKVNVADLPLLVQKILDGTMPDNLAARRAGLKATDITADENVIYAGDAKMDADGTVTLSVSMKNSVMSPGFQFDIAFPEGFDVAMDEDGFELIELSAARTTSKKTDTFAYNRIGERSYRILANSTRGLAFSGNDGEVCTIKLKTTTAVEPGDYDVVLSGIVISDLDGKTYKPGHDVVATITVDENVGAELIGVDAVDGAEIYGVDGVRRAGLQPGVNIVRYQNGVTCKIFVK